MWILTLTALALGGSLLNDEDRSYRIELDAELGLLAPMSHTVQFGTKGDELNYIQDGGQDNLFPFARPTAAIEVGRARFTALWQPLDLRSTVVLDRDLRVDGLVFPAQRPIDLRYGFSFWRVSWGQEVLQRDAASLKLGVGLQIRNATIGFTSVDGSLSETKRDIGPVPLLELEYRRTFEAGNYLEAEVDGFYAPIKYLNGGDVDVIGAIADMQVRAGLPLAPEGASTFLGVRYIGGGASGTGTPDGTGDGYTSNWLHFLTLTVGVRMR